jgi:DNA-binding CsgD family transcriptional regulator
MLLATEILDLVGAIPIGVVLVSADRQVLAVNRRATEIIQRKDSLVISNNFLSAVQSDQTKMLQMLVAGALRSGNSSHLSYPMLIPRVRSRPLMVVVVPAVSEDLGVHSDGIAAVLANDPDFRCQPNEELMRSLFQLTPMESRLASLLLQGTSLANAAKEMNVTLHTVRTYLKMTFQKTGTNRQSDLIYLMLNSPVSMSLDIRAITLSAGRRTVP